MKKLLDDPLLCSTLVTVVAFTPMVYNKHKGDGLQFSDALIILVFYIFVNWLFEELSQSDNNEQ